MPGEVKDANLSEAVPTTSVTTWKGQDARVADVVAHFTNSFHQRPSFFVRVPGRVNLIGEHVDYCGYGVFPMAIDQDVFVACRVVDSDHGQTLRLINTSSEYHSFECLIKDVKELLDNRKPGVSPPWHLYYLCGVLGILEKLGVEEGISMEVCVDGRVPARAGLSSSSALVCAAALATLVANKGEMGRKDIASLCAQSERYIGTQGGGMDQAIAFLATAGTAQKIEFVPELNGEKVRLPSTAVFVIANSLVEANKAASDGYNVRVSECRLATWILAKSLGLEFLQFEKLKQLQAALDFDFDEMMDLVKKNIHKEPYRAHEVAEVLGLKLEDLCHKPLMNRIPLEKLALQLNHRITHVLQEAARVQDFHRVCKEGADNIETLAILGKLMNGSHQSLRDAYECSHPQLDVLVELAQSRTHGARLTGAGWGGCMVALCDETQLTPFLDTLKREYYAGRDMGPHVFITQPGAGATILTV